MTTPQTDDPRAYRLDLADALAGGSAAAVAVALARCHTAGVSVPDEVRLRANSLLPSAVLAVVEEVNRWAGAARALNSRWVAADDPWEADELVRTLVELRTDAEGLLAVLGEELRPAVSGFDQALKAEEGLVSTLAGTPWLEGYRRAMPGVATEWWLNPTAEPPELPTAGFHASVRRVTWAKAVFPAFVDAPALAADVADESAPAIPTAVQWYSPDGRDEATLRLPITSGPAAEAEPRPLKLTTGGSPAAGVPIRLGNVSRTTDANGRVMLTLAELRPNWDGRLFVGTPEVELTLRTGDTE